MLRIKSCQLKSEICFYRCADIRRACGVNAPSTIFILMSNNPVCGFLKSLGITRPQQRVQQNVIGFKGSIGLKLSAPIPFLVLGREKQLASGARGSGHTPCQAIDFAETKLWLGS